MTISNRWLEDAMWPAIIGVMVGCIALSLVTLAERFVSYWDGTWLIPACGLVALEAVCSYRLLHLSFFSSTTLGFRIVELGVLFGGLELWQYGANGYTLLEAGDPSLDPSLSVLSGLAVVLVLVSWLAATRTAHDLDRLGEYGDHDPHDVAPTRRLGNRFFWGGAALFVAAGLTQVRTAGPWKLPGEPVSSPLINVLIYFLLGMLVLGQIRYTTLRRRWDDHEITVSPGLRAFWLRYSLAFVALVAILVVVLPAGHTAAVLDAGRAAGKPASRFALRVLILMKRPPAELLSLWHQHIHIHVSRAHPPVTKLRPPPGLSGGTIHHRSHGGGGGSGLGAHRTILIEVLAIAAVILAGLAYQVRAFSRASGPGGAPRTVSDMLAALRQMWDTLRLKLHGYVDSVVDSLPHPLATGSTEGTSSKGLRRFARTGKLSPRDQVFHYYRSMIRHADRAGVPRRRSQTPHEFNLILASRLSDVQADMAVLTDAFVEAQYSRHAIEAEHVDPVRQSFQRVRAALRTMRGHSGDRRTTDESDDP